MPVSQRQLAASIWTAAHIADREMIAAILLDEATTLADHNFLSRTSVGAQRYIWTGRYREFAYFGTSAVGVPCLLKALHQLPNEEPLVQETLRLGLCQAYVYHHGDGCRIVGSVVHARPNMPLPTVKPLARKRGRPASRRATPQLDLFAMDEGHVRFAC